MNRLRTERHCFRLSASCDDAIRDVLSEQQLHLLKGHIMAMEVEKMEVWVAGLDDRPGALAEKVEDLTQAGASLNFVLARRAPEKPGKGVVFVSPLKGAKQLRAAKDAGFHKTSSLTGFRLECPDKFGLGATLLKAIADAGINVQGLSASVIGKKVVCHFRFDSAADSAKAARILKKL